MVPPVHGLMGGTAMLRRILSALVFIPAVLFAVFETSTGGIVFLGVLLVCSWLTAHEYFDLVGSAFSAGTRFVGMTAVTCTVCLSFVLGGSLRGAAAAITGGDISAWPEMANAAGQVAMILSLKIFAVVLVFLVGSLLALFVIQIRRESLDGAFREVGLAFLSIPWIGFGFGSLAILHALPGKGPWLVLLAFVVVWVTDSFALFTGKILGRHRLGLAASPNKTVEGTIGGAVFGVLAAALLKIAFPVAYSGWAMMQWPEFLALALIFSIAGQVGDLAESVLKRSLGTKDSGRLVPGHGGLLDVFDAQMVVSPLVLGLTILLAGAA